MATKQVAIKATTKTNSKATETQTVSNSRAMPHNIETEQCVLGCILLDNNVGATVFGNLSENDFYSPTHKLIFSSMKGLFDKNKPVDFVTLTSALNSRGETEKAGGVDYLTTLTDIVPSSANLRHYIEILKRDSTLRKLIVVGNQIVQGCFETDNAQSALAEAERLVFGISREDERKELTLLSAELPGVIERFEAISRDPTIMRGLKTGFYSLDDITNGFQKSNLIVIAARPGEGKTSFGLNIVTNAAIKSKAKCAVFSLEMSKQELTTRALCAVACVDIAKAQRGELGPAEIARIFAANKELATADIYIDDNSVITPPEILSKCMQLKRERGGLDLVMVDYLGLMTGSGNRRESRQVEVADNSRFMKILAKELEVPVILISQLNRGVEKRGIDKTTGEDNPPVLSDLRESGAIEQDADIVMFIHNKNKFKEEQDGEGSDTEKREREIIIEKHRGGRQGRFTLHWVGAYTRFFNMPSAQAAQDAKDALEKSKALTQKPVKKATPKKVEQTVIASDDSSTDVF